MPRRSEAPPTPEELLRILHSGTNVSRQENERMKRQLRALSAAWINRTNVDDDIPPGISPDLPVMEASAMRLELAGLRMLAGKPQSETDAYINVMMESDPSIGLGLRCAIYKDRGHQHFKDGKYLEAVDMYKEGMRQILGKDTVLPSTEYLNKKYMDLKEGDWRLYIDLMECCERISACYERMNKPVEFVDWVEEIGMIYTCIRLARKPDEPSWISYHINFVEWFSFRVIADERAATVFRLLGNTSTASWFSRAAFKNTNHFQHPSLTAMREDLQWMDLAQIYHPNFRQLHTLQITQPDMQVRGVWKKIKPVASTSSASKPCGRSKHSAWIWNNRLYVAGGVTEVGSDIRDIWSFDLTERTWKQLPAMPNVAVEVNFKCSRNMSMWEDKAYWFTGSRTVWSFDLRAEKWSSLQTKFKGRWPYKTQNLTQYGSVTVDGRLYIFGGEDEVTCLGCNIFMALDLRTLEWEHLSGTSSNTPQIYEPNLRTFPSVFSIPKEKKIYVIGGNAGRSWAKRFPGKPHGSEWDHTYDDFWSFDIPTKKWHRERRRGNFPPPRTQMTATYNSNMERAVVYGGYNQEMMSAGYAEFALFGDAYLFNPETKLWQLVIALGFPSYRGSATMVSDPDTGKVYMFGGYTDTAYVPIKTAATRCFSDVWQLKVDMKGGDMSEEDLQIDWRTESVGPWKRCYSCANVGTDYKKCGGTCGGKWYFCSTECLRNGWPQHKASEGCKKK